MQLQIYLKVYFNLILLKMQTQIEDLIITLVEEEEMRVVEDVEDKLIQQEIDLSSNYATNMVI